VKVQTGTRRAMALVLAFCLAALAGAVAAGDEDEVARLQREIDRSDLERGIGKAIDIAKADILHLDPLEPLRRLNLDRFGAG